MKVFAGYLERWPGIRYMLDYHAAVEELRTAELVYRVDPDLIVEQAQQRAIASAEPAADVVRRVGAELAYAHRELERQGIEAELSTAPPPKAQSCYRCGKTHGSRPCDGTLRRSQRGGRLQRTTRTVYV